MKEKLESLRARLNNVEGIDEDERQELINAVEDLQKADSERGNASPCNHFGMKFDADEAQKEAERWAKGLNDM